MKKGILVISFGTSYPEAERASILAVESAVQSAYPDRAAERAYTSRMIIRKLRERGERVLDVKEGIESLRAMGCEEIIACSTHIIPGIEYEQAAREAGVPISEPLLADESDLVWMADLLGGIAAEEGRALLVMGHGTDHVANAVYLRLREKLPANVYLACVEGPDTLEKLLPELEKAEDRRITLMPLMLVAGDHARNDLSGEESDSWKSVLESRGFDVRARLMGLGELEEVRTRFLQKLAKIV